MTIVTESKSAAVASHLLLHSHLPRSLPSVLLALSFYFVSRSAHCIHFSSSPLALALGRRLSAGLMMVRLLQPLLSSRVTLVRVGTPGLQFFTSLQLGGTHLAIRAHSMWTTLQAYVRRAASVRREKSCPA